MPKDIELQDLGQPEPDFERSDALDQPVPLLRRLWVAIRDGPAVPEDNPPRFRSVILQRLEELPANLWEKSPRKSKLTVLVWILVWLLSLRMLLKPYLTEPPNYGTEGNPSEIVSFSCGHESSVWKGGNDKCGLDATHCNRTGEIVIRCPALCDSASRAFTAIEVGNSTVRYRNFYVGGGKKEDKDNANGKEELSLPYRADSFPCGAAIHAGIISPTSGGCARLRFTGPQDQFNATPSQYSDTDDSVSFDTFFPNSYQFVKTPDHCTNCQDPRVTVALVTILMGFPLMYLCPGQIGYWATAVSGFWVVVLSFDPPVAVDPTKPESLPHLVSVGFQRFLPCVFMLAVLWSTVCGTTLSDPTSPVCRTLIWFPLFWVGMLNNVTFDRLPVDRFTIQDMKAMPGAITAAIVLLVVTLCCAIVQTYELWRAGRLHKYALGYTVFFLACAFLSGIPGLQLRMHHYIIGLALVPGTSTKGFTAHLFQGVLMGLIVNGVARWGFASIEETDQSLLRDDSAGRIRPPEFTGCTPEGVVSWSPHAEQQGGAEDQVASEYSLLVNDVELYRGENTSVSVSSLANEAWGRVPDKLYMRLAQYGDRDDEKRSSYTRAALYEREKGGKGKFTGPLDGAT